MQFHWQVWNGGWIPEHTSMYESIINPPSDLAWVPFDCIPMQTFRSVEAQLDVAWSAAVAIVERGPFVAWVVEDVDQEAVGRVAGNFDINFLMR